MGLRENKVEQYFENRIRIEFNVRSRKIEKANIDGFPDRIFPLPQPWVGEDFKLQSLPILVEVKTHDGTLSAQQKREHERLRKMGFIITTVYGEKGVDKFIADCWKLGDIEERLQKIYR